MIEWGKMMKYNISVLIAGLMLAGCTTQSGSLMSMYEDQNATEIQEIDVPEQATEQTTQTTETAVEPVVRYRHNVAVKDHNADYITYEYRDIRVDELASLAIRYCDSQGGKKAYLRDIILYRNYNRRATFDCSNLATEK